MKRHRDLGMLVRYLKFLLLGKLDRRVGRGWFCWFRGRFRGGFSWTRRVWSIGGLMRKPGELLTYGRSHGDIFDGLSSSTRPCCTIMRKCWAPSST